MCQSMVSRRRGYAKCCVTSFWPHRWDWARTWRDMVNINMRTLAGVGGHIIAHTFDMWQKQCSCDTIYTILRYIIWWNNTFAHRHVHVAVRIVCVSENWCCCHFLASWSRNKGDTGGEVLLVHVSCHFCTPRASSGWLFWLGDSWWFFFFPSVLSSLLYFVVVFYKGFTLI